MGSYFSQGNQPENYPAHSNQREDTEGPQQTRRNTTSSDVSKADLEKQLEELKADSKAENSSLLKLIRRTRKDLNSPRNALLDIAITGASGTGKSSLVNALRGIADYEEGAAEVGETETTMEVKEYPHPTLQNVTIWDLPGIGASKFEAEKYLEMVDSETYDFFIIVSPGNFTEHEVLLSRGIHKMNRKFYYVRSKVDVSIKNEGMKPNFSEDKTLEKIRKYCCDKLKEAGESDPMVFLISRWDLEKYDFRHLVDTLEKELDELKRDALITMASDLLKTALKKKKAAMEALIEKIAKVSCYTEAVPVPGLSFVCNIPFLEATMRDFSRVFELDQDSFWRLAIQVGKPVALLSPAVRKTKIANEIDSEFVRSLLVRECRDKDTQFDGANSVSCLSHMLQSFLNDAQEDAENVWAAAFEK